MTSPRTNSFSSAVAAVAESVQTARSATLPEQAAAHAECAKAQSVVALAFALREAGSQIAQAIVTSRR